tara:strand:+ start:228 stop:413 length:186 start_codon:yes stop_codon:yes gene_type:complete
MRQNASLGAQIFKFFVREEVARSKRFELLTPRFVVWCSIQLSYERLPFAVAASVCGVRNGF